MRMFLTVPTVLCCRQYLLSTEVEVIPKNILRFLRHGVKCHYSVKQIQSSPKYRNESSSIFSVRFAKSLEQAVGLMAPGGRDVLRFFHWLEELNSSSVSAADTITLHIKKGGRPSCKNSIVTTYYAFCSFVFILTDLQVRPSVRLGRMSAHFVRLGVI